MTVKLTALSLGAGVQSTTMALMAAHGDLTPMPDCAITADPQAERFKTYAHLDWLRSGNVLPFPIHLVSAGSIITNLEAMTRGERWASIPAFVEGEDGRAAPIIRQCTSEFKIEPIHAKVRELMGFAPGQSFRHALGIGPSDPVPVLVEQWIGITWDERERQSDSGHAWIKNRWPLIELQMTRQDCERWLTAHEYPIPPKSACFFCPWTENERWRRMRDEEPEEWARAVAVDRLIAEGAPAGKTRAGTKPMFLHRSLKRLDEVDLTDLFDDAGGLKNECMGMCGV
jgi:hypothetical protein